MSDYKIIRSKSAGCFAGEIESREETLSGLAVIIINSRRLWYWSGAASLSQLAMEGTKNPIQCKFPCEVTREEIREVVEIVDVTETAKQSIKGVPVWQK